MRIRDDSAHEQWGAQHVTEAGVTSTPYGDYDGAVQAVSARNLVAAGSADLVSRAARTTRWAPDIAAVLAAADAELAGPGDSVEVAWAVRRVWPADQWIEYQRVVDRATAAATVRAESDDPDTVVAVVARVVVYGPWTVHTGSTAAEPARPAGSAVYTAVPSSWVHDRSLRLDELGAAVRLAQRYVDRGYLPALAELGRVDPAVAERVDALLAAEVVEVDDDGDLDWAEAEVHFPMPVGRTMPRLAAA